MSKIIGLKNIFIKYDLAIYFLVGFFGLYSLFEVFVFSESFALSAIRQIDDPTYHLDIRRLHESFLKFDIHQILLANNNGYGWAFWILHALFTFPFYILDKIYDFPAPYVASGRILSVIFTCCSGLLLFRICKLYSRDKLNQFFIVFSFFIFPAVITSSMRFCSDTQAVFFGMLAIYLTIKETNFSRKNLFLIALTLGLAVGTKFTAIFVTPLIAFHFLNSYNYKLSKLFLKDALFFVGAAIFFTILFTNPGFLLYPFDKTYTKYFFDTLRLYKVYASENSGTPDDLLYLYKQSIGWGFMGNITTLISLGLLFSVFMKNHKFNRAVSTNFLVMFFSLVITFLFLVIKVKKGAPYINLYFYIIAYYLCFSFVAFEYFPKKICRIVSALFFCLILSEKAIPSWGALNQFYVMRKLTAIQDLFQAHDELRTLVSHPKLSKKRVAALVDYRAVFPYFELDGNLKYIVSIDDIGVRKKWFPYFDYVVLSRRSTAFLSEVNFKSILSMADHKTATKLKDDKKHVSRLLVENMLDDVEYENIYDKNSIIVFKRKK